MTGLSGCGSTACGCRSADGGSVVVVVEHVDGGAVEVFGPVGGAGAGEDAEFEGEVVGFGVGDVVVDGVVGGEGGVWGGLEVGPGDFGDVAVDGAAPAGVGGVLAVEEAAEDGLEQGGGGGVGGGGVQGGEGGGDGDRGGQAEQDP